MQMAVIKVLVSGEMSSKAIFMAIGLAEDSRSFKRHIEPFILYGLVEMTVPAKPNSRMQKYRLTVKGVEVRFDCSVIYRKPPSVYFIVY